MNLDPQQLLRKWLAEEYATRTRKNRNFSMRAFARKLQVSPSALSEIFSGKRSVSEEKAMALLDLIGSSRQTMAMLQEAYAKSAKIKKLKRYEPAYSEEILPTDFYDLLADWRYFAVMSLMRAQAIEVGEAAPIIAERLQIDRRSVKRILKKLQEAELIAADAEGIWRCASKVFRSPESYPKKLLDQRAKDGFKLAARAMDDPQKWHYVDLATITADPERLREAEGMIDDFVKRLGVFLGSGNGTQVMELSVNLFSLSKAPSQA